MSSNLTSLSSTERIREVSKLASRRRKKRLRSNNLLQSASDDGYCDTCSRI